MISVIPTYLLGGPSGGDSFGMCRVVSKMYLTPADANLCGPHPSAFDHPHTKHAPDIFVSKVSRVFTSRDISEVLNSVVRSVMIYVVALVRPFAMNICPSSTMGQVSAFEDVPADITAAAGRPQGRRPGSLSPR